MNTQITIGLAFLAGLASFLSPCVLPLVPVYLAQLVGKSTYQANPEEKAFSARLITFFHATMFVTGFTLAFITLGATASTLGFFMKAHLGLLRQLAGLILIVMGLQVSGLLRLPFLSQQKRFLFRLQQPSYPASLLFGLIFGVAWTPCIGPILSSILLLAARSATLPQGVWLLLFYSLGLSIPFLLLGLGIDHFSLFLKRLKPHLGKIEMATGVLMITLGIIIFFNLLLYLNQCLNFGIVF
jgi:cytochrome c-type biogenesis protein